jgi:hypothetical protein
MSLTLKIINYLFSCCPKRITNKDVAYPLNIYYVPFVFLRSLKQMGLEGNVYMVAKHKRLIFPNQNIP